MENSEEETPALGRTLPSPEDIAAIQLGIRRYGIAGLVRRTGIGWSVVCGSGFGCPVRGESLNALRTELSSLNLYVSTEVSASV